MFLDSLFFIQKTCVGPDKDTCIHTYCMSTQVIVGTHTYACFNTHRSCTCSTHTYSVCTYRVCLASRFPYYTNKPVKPKGKETRHRGKKGIRLNKTHIIKTGQ